MKTKALALLVLMAMLLGMTACVETATPTTAAPVPSYWPTQAWRTSTPEEQGMDSEMLADMLETIEEQDYDIDGVVVVRNGYVVVEATVCPFEPGSRHLVYSCTKSVVSALIGIAIDEGYIEGVDQLVLDFFPERTAANLDADKEAMMLEDVLTMSTGVDGSSIYMALGYSGQYIVVVPDKDMVVVFVSDLSENDFYVPQTLLNDFIIPAAKPLKPLPANPDGVALLESRIEALANP